MSNNALLNIPAEGVVFIFFGFVAVIDLQTTIGLGPLGSLAWLVVIIGAVGVGYKLLATA